MPDGSELDLNTTQKDVGAKKVVVLTCDSLDYFVRKGTDAVVTTRRLEFDEMAKAVLAVGKSKFYGGCKDFGQLLNALNRELAQGRGPADRVLKIGAISAVGGITILGAIQLKPGGGAEECSCEKECKCGLEPRGECKCGSGKTKKP